MSTRGNTPALFPARPAAPHAILVRSHPADSRAASRLWLCLHLCEPSSADLRRLALWAGRFTPQISLEPPDAALLEIAGSLRLYGGIAPLLHHARTGARERTGGIRTAVAPTALAALWLARAGCESVVTDPARLTTALGRLPPDCLRWPDRTRELLHALGVRRLADCLRLPRAGLARRLGKARLDELDRALGRAPDPRAWFEPPATFAAERELPAPFDDHDRLLAALDGLLEELEGFLRLHYSGTRTLAIGFSHAGGTVTPLTLSLSAPMVHATQFNCLLRERLERFCLPAPVIALHLGTCSLERIAQQSRELFGGKRTVESPELVSLLRARLGDEAVRGLSPVSEHRPEAAWRYVEPGTCVNGGPWPPRPAWMLPEPRVLQINAGRPVCAGPLVLVQGPERIESGWWDDGDVARDYYVAETPAGVRLWVFRERYGRRRWYWQGVFA